MNLLDDGKLNDDDLKQIFMEFDLNGDGLIQKNELKEVMVRMGQCPTEDELDTMFRSADRDDDGNIDLEEFLSIAHRNPIALSLRTVFDEIDVDGDGYLRRSELRQAFQRMGHTLTDSDMNAIYRHVDTNNDGRINFDGN
ncbi:unnamed protein product [Enterobius vermicularis]|uniref:Calmodulin n=1 Tax=Enterobius vermicularis TaxID=51028 RepID=A0A0N4V0R2_ENTVE|nr:unnamed protein product [Enterobius vermicularis]